MEPKEVLLEAIGRRAPAVEHLERRGGDERACPFELEARLAPAGLVERDVRRAHAHAMLHDRPPFDVPHVARLKLERARALVATPTLEVLDRRRSPTDGFQKYLFRLHDGLTVEAVRIPIFDDKYTVCISSQAGCPLACAFCATGRLGLARSLAAWEIVEQVRVVRREADRPVRGIVFMGMGEPFLNYDEVVRAARILSAPTGLAISGKAITISTAGIVPAIRRYTAEGWPFRLAVSVTAATSELRRTLMPVERTYPLPDLVDALRAHALDRRERVTVEYVAISGVNCAPADAEALGRLFAGIPLRLNLIEVNDASGRFLPPSAEEWRVFRDALGKIGASIVRRYSGGKDVDAACGMLASLTGPPRSLPLAT